VISLSAEAHRRKVTSRATPPDADLDRLVYDVTEQILADHADVVYAVAAGRRGEDVLERLVTQVVIAKGLGTASLQDTVRTILDYILRYGPLQPLIDDPAVTDIFVNGPRDVWVRRDNQDHPQPGIAFRDEAHLIQYIRAVLARAGARVNASHCLADARDLQNRIRINAGIPPAAPKPYLAIRKHTAVDYSEDDMLRTGAVTPEILRLLRAAIDARANIVISGPTGSGKTTLLRFLANHYIPPDDRIVVLEEEAELALRHPNQVALETKKRLGEDDTEITLNDLVRNALRMAPRRIILGELRGREAFALLRAFGTGHDGGLTTVHANDLANTLDQLAVMMLFEQTPLEYEHLYMLAADAVNLIVYVEHRRVSDIAWVGGYDRTTRRAHLEILVETRRRPDGQLEHIYHQPSEAVRSFFWRRGVRLE